MKKCKYDCGLTLNSFEIAKYGDHCSFCPKADARPASVASDTERGLYRKYKIERTDGSSAPGGKHEECAYFILDLVHDPFSGPALLAYADACEGQYPQLAADLRRSVKGGGMPAVRNIMSDNETRSE